ncbi:MAG: hypothetical protein ACM3PY_02680 [Omnitrophica WOR_2 bacterium]
MRGELRQPELRQPELRQPIVLGIFRVLLVGERMVCSFCGTDQDPQDLEKQKSSLQAAGVCLLPSRALEAQGIQVVYVGWSPRREATRR